MKRIVLGLEYAGDAFCGWQSQAHGRTVQDVLEAALRQIAAHPVRLHCAGRTDTGVHASAQVVHFDTAAQRPPSATCQVSRTSGSSARSAASTQGAPQTMALSRARMRAWARRSGAIRPAVRSPAPTSSASARCTSACASACTARGSKRISEGVFMGREA